MRKFIYTLFVFVFLSSVAFGQTNKAPVQPSCKSLIGLQTCDKQLIPKNYTGIVKCCKNSKVKYLINLKNGQKNGIQRQWDGDQISQSYWINGKKNGVSRGWDKSKLSSYETWKNGQKNGESKKWAKGKLFSKSIYKEGSLVNKKCYDSEGNQITCRDLKPTVVKPKPTTIDSKVKIRP